ncbi:MAG: DNA-binding protein [Sulfurimonas sp.]
MSKMSVNDAAEHFGVSKEAIHNRIRRGSLKSIIEDGVKLVIIDASRPKRTAPRLNSAKSLGDEKYYKLLEDQNSKLQSRVDTLETETRTLRDQKEEMLIQERIQIENIYKEKDEQLKNILSTISSKFMLNAPQEEVIEPQEEHLEAEIETTQEPTSKSKVISLKKYLKKLKLSDKKQEKIKKKFDKLYKKDKRIILYGKKYYVDVKKFSYSDLI